MHDERRNRRPAHEAFNHPLTGALAGGMFGGSVSLLGAMLLTFSGQKLGWLTLLLPLILSGVLSGCAGQRTILFTPAPSAEAATPAEVQPTATTAAPLTNTPAPTPTQPPVAATPTPPAPTQPANPAPTAAALGVEYWESLPIPADVFEMITRQNGPESLLIATSFSDLPTTLDFYRRELPQQGWQEKPETAVISDTQALLMFEVPEASLKVELYRTLTGLTDIKLTRTMAPGAPTPVFPADIPAEAETYYYMGMTKVAAGLIEEAITDLDQAISLYPNYALAYHARGLAHSATNNLDQAIADYTQALAIDQSLIPAYLDRAKAYAKQGEREKAQADCRQLLALNPDPDVRAEAEALLRQLEESAPGPKQITDLPSLAETPIAIQDISVEVRPGQPFTLATAQAAHLAEGDFSFFFQTVLEDVRCPSQVLCAHSGWARILVGLQPQDQAARLVEMSTNPPSKSDAFLYAGYEIRLLNLDPYPEEIDQQIPLETYQATFIISKN